MYHHNCVNITTAHYMANNFTLRKHYTCDQCAAQQNDNENRQQTETEIEKNYVNVDPIRNDQCCFVTQRKPRQNISQEQSESILDFSYQSLPNIDTQNYQDLEDLRNENKKLKLNIDTAHTEIENMNLEIINLKKTIEEISKKNDFYRSLGLGDLNTGNKASPKRYFSPQYRKINPGNMKIGFPSTSQSNLTNAVVKQIDSNTFTTKNLSPLKSTNNMTISPQIQYYNETQNFKAVTRELEKNITIKVTRDEMPAKTNDANKVKNMATLSQNFCKEEKLEKRVILFADERGRGLRTSISHLLGPGFIATTVIKPYASLEEVLTLSRSECMYLTENDYVIIMAGSNDRDPLNMQSVLYCNLKALRHTNVIVCNVGMTTHLNESMTNECLKFVCSRFSNAVFVDIYDYVQKRTSLKFNKIEASRILQREIMRVDFKQAYLRKNIKNQIKPGLEKTNVATQTEAQEVETVTNIITNHKDTQTEEFFRS